MEKLEHLFHPYSTYGTRECTSIYNAKVFSYPRNFGFQTWLGGAVNNISAYCYLRYIFGYSSSPDYSALNQGFKGAKWVNIGGTVIAMFLSLYMFNSVGYFIS